VNASETDFSRHLARRHRLGRIFGGICLVSTWFGIIALGLLLAGVVWKAAGWLNWSFLTSYDSRFPEKAGILAAMWGSFWLIVFTILITVPVGVGAAIYLEEFATEGRLTRLIQVNLANLAGVPSIVYGILGLTLFVRTLGLGRSVIAGALTLSLLVLPVVIVSAQEALKAVPASLRHASLALGATQWQTVRHQVLPASIPGILTGVILAVSRAIGETAPLVMIGALTYLAFTPGDIESPLHLVTRADGLGKVPLDSYTALPIQIFNWVSLPQTEYQHVAAAGILVLLVILLVLNGAAIFIRQRSQKHSRW